MPYPQPPFEHDSEYWAYNDLHVDKDKLAHVLVHREAWCSPTVQQEAGCPYNVELVRAYARNALEKHAAGQWCLRFERGRSAPIIWPCAKARPTK
jgi:hypothetical protein